MAITKIHAIKSTLGKALAYIENPDKTDGQMLVSGYNCEPQTAYLILIHLLMPVSAPDCLTMHKSRNT